MALGGKVIGEAFVTIRPLTKDFGKETEQGTKASFQRIAQIGGTAIAGLGGALTKVSREFEKNQIALKRAVENSGQSIKDYSERIGQAVKEQARLGNSATQVNEALTKLTLRTQDPDQALKALGVTADLAALKNISLGEAADLVGRIFAGNAKAMKAFGIEGSQAADAATRGAENLKALSGAIGGIAPEQADTLIGKLEGIKTSLQNVAQQSGGLGPVLLGLGTALATVGGIIQGVQAGLDIGLFGAMGRFVVGAAKILGPIGAMAGAFLLLARYMQDIVDISGQIDEKLSGLIKRVPVLGNLLTNVLDPLARRLNDLAARFGRGFLDLLGVDVKTDTHGITGVIKRRHQGGLVDGIPSFQRGGEVPILAQPGEYVMRREAVNRLGVGAMNAINSGGGGGGGTATIVMNIDGREFARVTAPYVTDEQIRQNRGNVDIFGGRA